MTNSDPSAQKIQDLKTKITLAQSRKQELLVELQEIQQKLRDTNRKQELQEIEELRQQLLS